MRAKDVRRAAKEALIVRFGDFLGPAPGSNWFSQGLVTPGKRLAAITCPEAKGAGRAWAYLPGAGEAVARLAGPGGGGGAVRGAIPGASETRTARPWCARRRRARGGRTSG